jgi:hypothetical protein
MQHCIPYRSHFLTFILVQANSCGFLVILIVYTRKLSGFHGRCSYDCRLMGFKPYNVFYLHLRLQGDFTMKMKVVRFFEASEQRNHTTRHRDPQDLICVRDL